MPTRTEKWLIGCGIGCGSIVLLAIIVVVSFSVWITRPGELIEPSRLLEPETTGYAEWILSLDHPGTQRFVDRLIESTQRVPEEVDTPLPPMIDAWIAASQNRNNEQSIRRLFPLALAWTMRPGEGPDEDRHLMVLSLKQLGNQMVFADWMIGWAFGQDKDGRLYRYRGEKIYGIADADGERFVFFIRGNDVFFSFDRTIAEQAVDRLSGRVAEPTSRSALDDRLRGLPDDASLRAVVSNERGEIERLAHLFYGLADATPPDPDLLASVRGLTLAGRLEEDGSLAGTLELLGPDADWAAAYERPFTAALGALGGDDGQLVLEGRAAGERIRVDFRAPDLTAVLGLALRGGFGAETESGRVRVRP